MSKFYFFTDPGRLDTQVAGQPFGPAEASPSKDQFRVTDLHAKSSTSTAAATAYAVCRGRVCVQAVRGSGNQILSLNLILRPLEQPPFDFPYVEYFIYRNIEVNSLVNASGDLDLGKEGSSPNQNDLIAFIRSKVLKRSAPESGTEAGKYIGLDRAHDPTPGANGGVFGDAKPIDHLFRYPGGAELPMVEAGWKLGEFVGASFGFEVVVQTYGAQPKLGWARQPAAALIEADIVGTAATDDQKYSSRLAREAIGCFVDPCAFWGMFFHSGLYFRSPGTNDDKKSLKGKPLCDKLFPVSGGPFLNRDRLYLNLRNETGYSYNFYRNYEDPSENSLQIGPDAGNLLTKKYGVDGWPIHFEDALPGNTFCFRLGRINNLSPLLFLHQTGQKSPGKRFMDKQNLLDAGDPVWTKPVIFTRPRKSGARPPWCFVAHYLRGRDGLHMPASPTGVFDTAPLQFGPIGDRVVAAYDELWPASVTTSSPSTKNYERIFVSDKVFRYDGGSKSDPVDSTIPARSLAYDRVGDTYYILQKGTATATAGQDSVVTVQRRQYGGPKDFSGTWNKSNAVSITTANQDLFFKLLLGQSLSTPVFKSLNTGSGLPVTVPTFLELLNDTPVKADLFDFTFLCLSKVTFGAAAVAAKPVSPNPAATEKHALFLSLSPLPPSTSSASPYSAYDVECHGWDGQTITSLLPATAKTSIYSADGVFFSSSDFDRGSLVDVSAYETTEEEKRLAYLWSEVIGRDKKGAADQQMGSLVASFTSDLSEIVGTAGTSNPESDLLALVEDYGRRIWDRAVTLVQDTTPIADSSGATYTHQAWSDRILYCARAKMEVALKSNPDVRAKPDLEKSLIDRFEALSRNYAGLDFTGAKKSNDEKAVILAGFDPFWEEKSGSEKLAPNPSGALVLYFANEALHEYTKAESNHRQLYIKGCIFPGRYGDFDKGVVENTVDAALTNPPPNDIISLICTCSHDGGIKPWVDFKSDSVDRFHFRIDRFAAKCRGGFVDNNKAKSSIVDPNSLPKPTNKENFYETGFLLGDLSRYDASKAGTTAPGIILRYNEVYWYEAFDKGVLTRFSRDIKNYPGVGDSQDGDAIFDSGYALPSIPLPSTAKSATTVITGSGGQYLSNELFFRVSNLIQSSYLSRPDLQVRYAGIRNGHIHMPHLDLYPAPDSRNKSLDQFAESVLAVLDGVLGP